MAAAAESRPYRSRPPPRRKSPSPGWVGPSLPRETLLSPLAASEGGVLGEGRGQGRKPLKGCGPTPGWGWVQPHVHAQKVPGDCAPTSTPDLSRLLPRISGSPTDNPSWALRLAFVYLFICHERLAALASDVDGPQAREPPPPPSRDRSGPRLSRGRGPFNRRGRSAVGRSSESAAGRGEASG